MNTSQEISREITNAENVLAIYVAGPTDVPFTQLVFVAWDDGTIIWSDDRLNGGPPYHTATVDTNRIHDTLKRFEKDGLFSDLSVYNGGCVGFEWTVLYVRKDEKIFEDESCHEQSEQPGVCVAVQGAISPLGERKRFKVLAKQPQEYLFSRMLWLELRRTMEAFIPVNGLPCSGQVEMLHGLVSWLPEPTKDRRTMP